MKTLHTIIGSRHYAHKDNIPTRKWLKVVKENTQAIADQFQGKEKANIFATDKRRTGGTAKTIARNLKLKVTQAQVIHWLSYEPESGPMKDIYIKLWEHYDQDPNIAKQGYSDEFVYKMQHNQLDGVDFNKLAVFNTTKLYNLVSYLSKNPQESDLSIGGIHGAYFLESILYTLWWDDMPTTWNGQIKTGENFILKVVQTDQGELWLSVDYRGIQQTISLVDMKIAMDKLRK